MNGSSNIRRGRLRIYLGAAAGVGKTYAMLSDARAAVASGGDVVIGYLEPHGRAQTEGQADGLQRAPVVDATGRRADVGVDVPWLVQRAPSVALVDELAHTNAPGSMHDKRSGDVDELLRAGIDVWTTVNVQHLDSLNERVRELVGVEVRETFPDRYLHDADEIRLIDVSPIALRERIAAGLVYRTDRIDAALAGFFTIRNLTALRALALHEMAENAARQLQQLDDEARTTGAPVERVLAAVGGRAESTDRLVRRAARLARRTSGELVVLHVKPRGAVLDAATQAGIQRAAELTDRFGGAFIQRESDDPAAEIVHEARAQRATQIVLGATDRSRVKAAFAPSPIDAIMRSAHGIDLYVVARPAPTSAGEQVEG